MIKRSAKAKVGRKERENNDFTKHLQEYLEDKKELYDSQNAMADVIGVSGGTMSHMLNDTKTPNLETLYKLYQAYGDSLDYMVGISKCKSINGNTKAILSTTGLSNSAYKNLSLLNKREDKGCINLVNALLEDEEFCKTLLPMIANAYKAALYFPRKNLKDTWITHSDIIDTNKNGFVIDGIGFAKQTINEASNLFKNIINSIIISEWNKTLKGGK